LVIRYAADIDFNGPWRQQVRPFAVMGLFFPMVMTIAACNPRVVLRLGPAAGAFLIPAPFSARQLILFLVASRFVKEALTGCILVPWFMLITPHWQAGVIGLAAYSLLLGLAQIAAAAVLRDVIRWCSLWVTGIASGAALIAMLAVGWYVASRTEPVWLQLEAWQSTLPGRVLFAPARIVAGLILSANWGEFAFRFLELAALCASIFALLLWLEPSLGSEDDDPPTGIKRDRVERTGWSNLLRWGSRSGWSGIACRQALIGWRRSNWLSLGLIPAGIAMWSVVLYQIRVLEAPGFITNQVATALVAIGIMAARFFPFDFRQDWPHLALIKTLPLHPLAIVAGEMAPPLVFVCAAQALALTALTVVFGFRPEIGLGLVVAVPYTFFMLSYDNLLFLLFPPRFQGLQPADEASRMLVVGFMKTVLFLVTVAIAVGLCSGAYWILGKSIVAFAACIGVTFALGGCAITLATAETFRRFDPNRMVNE
jgi:hypothetical protein